MRDSNMPSEERGENAEEQRFVERIAIPLRRAEQVDVTFEARVMSAVHAEARAGALPGAGARPRALEWWLKPRVLRATPLLGGVAADRKAVVEGEGGASA